MGIAKQKLTKDQKSSKKSHHKQPRPPAIVNRRTGRKPRDITDNERTCPTESAWAPDDESMSPESAPKAQPGESGDRLRSEVEILVSLECRKIARAMVRNTINGNMSVARLL